MKPKYLSEKKKRRVINEGQNNLSPQKFVLASNTTRSSNVWSVNERKLQMRVSLSVDDEYYILQILVLLVNLNFSYRH